MSAFFCAEALEISKDNKEVYYILGMIALHRFDMQNSHKYFSKAQALAHSHASLFLTQHFRK